MHLTRSPWLSRPVLTLAPAPFALAAVALWGAPGWLGSYALFVAVTAAAVVLAALVRPGRGR